MATENGMDFAHLLAYSVVGGSLVGLAVTMFIVRGYTLDMGLVGGAIAGVAFAIVAGSLNGKL